MIMNTFYLYIFIRLRCHSILLSAVKRSSLSTPHLFSHSLPPTLLHFHAPSAFVPSTPVYFHPSFAPFTSLLCCHAYVSFFTAVLELIADFPLPCRLCSAPRSCLYYEPHFQDDSITCLLAAG